MKVSIYHRRRFHSDVIKRVIWLYFRFNLSLREIEELMAERGVDVSYETIRRWIEQIGPVFAKRIKTRSPNPSTCLLYTSPSPRDGLLSRMPSSA